MSDHKGLCVVCDIGYQIPTGYGDAMLKMPSNVYGAVVRRSPNIAALRIERPERQLTKDQLGKINKTYEGHRIIHFLGNYPDGYIKDSLQPFSIIPSGEGGSALAAILVGDFKKHLPSTESTKLSAENWCVNNHIVPMMQRWWRMTKEDPNAFNEELKTSSEFFKELIGLQGGLITLMLATKDDTVIHQFQKSLPTFKKFQWGTTSDILDYVTGVAETPKDAKPPETKDVKHKSKLVVTEAPDEDVDEAEAVPVVIGRRQKSEEKVEAASAKVDSKQPEAKAKPKDSRPIIENVSEKEVVLASGAIVRRIKKGDSVEYMWFPPLLVTKNRNLRKAYLQACGRTLSNQELGDRVGVRLTNQTLLQEVQKSFADLQVLGPPSDAERFKPAETGKETVEVQNKVTGEKAKVDVTPKPLPEGGSPIYAAVNAVDKHFIAKHLDKNGMEVLDPTKTQDLEDTTKMFHEEFPLIFSSFEDTWRIKPEMRTFLNSKCPGAMAMWQGDLIRYCVNVTKLLEQATDPNVVKKAKAA